MFQIVTKYGTDAEITALLDYADWLITPVSNPDGYEYTWTTVNNSSRKFMIKRFNF
jgi:carboxypeptidase A2